MKRELITLSLGLLVGTALSSVAAAQQTTGVPGAPDATSTIDGRQMVPAQTHCARKASSAKQDASARHGENALIERYSSACP